MIKTFNSRFDVNGNRRNLVINEDTKEIYYYGSNAFNLGDVSDNLGIREVDRIKKDYIEDGYKVVSHSVVRDNWM